MSGHPRRWSVDRLTPPEAAIREAQLAVEKAGAHRLLTQAAMLLDEARQRVADFVDSQPYWLVEFENGQWQARDGDHVAVSLYTNDVHRALRFATKEAAEAWLTEHRANPPGGFYGYLTARPTEHMDMPGPGSPL